MTAGDRGKRPGSLTGHGKGTMLAACLRLEEKEYSVKPRALRATNGVFESCGEGLCLLCIKWGATGGPAKRPCVYNGEGIFILHLC